MKKTTSFAVFVLSIMALLLSACGAAATPNTGGGRVEPIPVAFTGTVESMAADQWVINGQTVTVDPAVVQDGPFDVGDQVKVEGVVNADGSFTVSRVEVPTADDLSTLPQFGVGSGNDNSNDANSNDANANDDNGNNSNSNDDNSNAANSNDDTGNNANTNDDEGNDANSNDGNGNDANINDDNGNDANSNDDNGSDANTNDDNGGDDNSNDDQSGGGGNNNDDGGGNDNGGSDDNGANDSGG